MANCKQCGQTIVWPQPYVKGQRPFGPDGVSLHECPAFKKGTSTSIEQQEAILDETQAMIDEEARKREQATMTKSKDDSIREMFDIKQDLSKEFLAEKRRYNDLYEREVIAYEKEIQMKMTEEVRRQHNTQ